MKISLIIDSDLLWFIYTDDVLQPYKNLLEAYEGNG